MIMINDDGVVGGGGGGGGGVALPSHKRIFLPIKYN